MEKQKPPAKKRNLKIKRSSANKDNLENQKSFANKNKLEKPKSSANKDKLEKQKSSANNYNLEKPKSSANNDNLEKQKSPANNDNLEKQKSPANKDNLEKQSSSANNDSLEKQKTQYSSSPKKENPEKQSSSANKENPENHSSSANKENPENHSSSANKENLEQQSSSSTNHNLEQQRSTADDDNTEVQISSADNEVSKDQIQNVKIKSLADLIGYCRDKGIQVYNDTPNVPEADRLRMEALGKQDGAGAKKHRSDAREPSLPDRKKEKSGKKSLKSVGDRSSSRTDSAMTKLDVTSRKTSAVPSVSGRSFAASRMSSALSTYDIQDRNKDADELLLQRMRKRSKRRREVKGTLMDFVTEVSKKAEMKIIEDSANSENPDSVNSSEEKAGNNVTGDDNTDSTKKRNQEESVVVNGVAHEQTNSVTDVPRNTRLRENDNFQSEDLENSINENEGLQVKGVEKSTIDATIETNVKNLEESNTVSKPKEVGSVKKQLSDYSDTNEHVKHGMEEQLLNETPNDHTIQDASNGNNQQITNLDQKQNGSSGVEEKGFGTVEINESVNKTEHVDQIKPSDHEQDKKASVQGNTESINQSQEKTQTDSEREIEEHIEQTTSDVVDRDISNVKTADTKSDLSDDGKHVISADINYELPAGDGSSILVNGKRETVDDGDVNKSVEDQPVAINDGEQGESAERKSDLSADENYFIVSNEEGDKMLDKKTDAKHDISANIDSDINTEQKGSTQQHTSKTNGSTENVLSEADAVNMKDETENDSENVIEEVRIKDGNSTLVLYKVKEKSLLSLGKNTDNVNWKQEVTISDGNDGRIDDSTDIKEQVPKKQNSENAELVRYDDNVNNSTMEDVKTIEINNVEKESESDEEDYNSEAVQLLSFESPPIGNKDNFSKSGDSFSKIDSAEHDENINNYNKSLRNKEKDMDTLSKNKNSNDQTNDGTLISGASSEKSMNDYNLYEDDQLSITENNLENVETLMQTMHNEQTEVNLIEGNAQSLDRNETNDMADSLPGKKDGEGSEGKKSEDETETLVQDEETDTRKKEEIEDNEMRERVSEDTPKKGLTAETNISSEKMLSYDARLIYLLEKTKKTNTEYGIEHKKTIRLFQEARNVFTKDVSFTDDWATEGKDAEENSAEDNTESQEKENLSDTKENDKEQVEEKQRKTSDENQEGKEEINAEVSEEPVKEAKRKKKKKVKQGPKFTEERLQEIRAKYWSNGQGNSETFELDGEEYYLDPNGDLVKSIKLNASKKIDTRWDPHHPMFKKMLNKNKAPDLKGIAHTVKVMKTSKINTGDVPANNVYVEEAKRIFPQGFEDVATNESKTSTSNKKVKKVVKSKTKSVDIGNTGQEDTGDLTKIETVENDKPVKRKLKRVVSVPTKIGATDNSLSDEVMAPLEGDTNKRKLRKIKSVSSKMQDSKIETVNENEELKALVDGKKVRVKAVKQNNYVIPENDSITDNSAAVTTEKKTVVIKRKKIIKPKVVSDKEFEVDRAFLNEQKQFIEKTTKINKTEKQAPAKENVIQKSRRTSHKNSIPELEFKSKDELSDHSKSNSIAESENRDKLNQFDKGDSPTLSKGKSSKKKNSDQDQLNALRIFKEARNSLAKSAKGLRSENGSPEGHPESRQANKLENGSRSSMLSGKSDVSISAAVEIVQSRNKFYEPMANGEDKMKSEESLLSIRSEQYKEKRTKRTPSIPAF